MYLLPVSFYQSFYLSLYPSFFLSILLIYCYYLFYFVMLLSPSVFKCACIFLSFSAAFSFSISKLFYLLVCCSLFLSLSRAVAFLSLNAAPSSISKCSSKFFLSRYICPFFQLLTGIALNNLPSPLSNLSLNSVSFIHSYSLYR